MAEKQTIAVIGTGLIGKAVAGNLVKGNRPVIIADRKIEKAEQLSQQLGNLAQPMEIQQAVKSADILILAIYFDPIKSFFVQYASELAGKIIIDPSNPITLDEKGGFTKIVGKDESAGEILSGLIPENVKLVKALCTLGAETLTRVAFQQPDKAVLFYATDETSVNDTIEELIHDSGFEALRVGGLDQSIRLEVFGDLNEFGAVGKPVTLAEAKGLVQ